MVHERGPFNGCPSRYEASSEILPPQGNKESFADELLDNAVVIELFDASALRRTRNITHRTAAGPTKGIKFRILVSKKFLCKFRNYCSALVISHQL